MTRPTRSARGHPSPGIKGPILRRRRQGPCPGRDHPTTSSAGAGLTAAGSDIIKGGTAGAAAAAGTAATLGFATPWIAGLLRGRRQGRPASLCSDLRRRPDGSLVYVDHGLSGANRDRPGLDQALAAVREGDTLVVPKLDRLARSVPDARAIGDDLAARGVALALGTTVYDPTDPMGKMFFNILATFAEFELDLIRARTREGMAVARARGRLKGRKPKLTDRQAAELCRMRATGDYTIADLMEVFDVGRATVYRTLQRAEPDTTQPTSEFPGD